MSNKLTEAAGFRTFTVYILSKDLRDRKLSEQNLVDAIKQHLQGVDFFRSRDGRSVGVNVLDTDRSTLLTILDGLGLSPIGADETYTVGFSEDDMLGMDIADDFALSDKLRVSLPFADVYWNTDHDVVYVTILAKDRATLIMAMAGLGGVWTYKEFAPSPTIHENFVTKETQQLFDTFHPTLARFAMQMGMGTRLKAIPMGNNTFELSLAGVEDGPLLPIGDVLAAEESLLFMLPSVSAEMFLQAMERNGIGPDEVDTQGDMTTVRVNI